MRVRSACLTTAAVHSPAVSRRYRRTPRTTAATAAPAMKNQKSVNDRPANMSAMARPAHTKDTRLAATMKRPMVTRPAMRHRTPAVSASNSRLQCITTLFA